MNGSVPNIPGILYFKIQKEDLNGPESYIAFDSNTYKLTYQVANAHSLSPYTVGVKIDGGAFQPLYFNGQIKSIQALRSVSTIDIYIKSEFDDLLSWPRITINPRKALIQMYQDALFPIK